MTEREVLKLALEFIKSVHKGEWSGSVSRHQVREAIKEALAEPEQEPVAWRETHSKVIKALAAIVTVHTPDKLFDLDAIPRDPVMGLVHQIKVAIDGYKPPQRTWVGLTDEEKRQLFDREDYQGWLEYINAIEAKLKEKNT